MTSMMIRNRKVMGGNLASYLPSVDDQSFFVKAHVANAPANVWKLPSNCCKPKLVSCCTRPRAIAIASKNIATSRPVPSSIRSSFIRLLPCGDAGLPTANPSSCIDRNNTSHRVGQPKTLCCIPSACRSTCKQRAFEVYTYHSCTINVKSCQMKNN